MNMLTTRPGLERNTMHPGVSCQQQPSQQFMVQQFYAPPVEPCNQHIYLPLPPPPVQYFVAPPVQPYGQFAQVANNQVNLCFQPDMPTIPTELFDMYQQNRMLFQAPPPALVHPTAYIPEQHPISAPNMAPHFSNTSASSLPMVYVKVSPSHSPRMEPFDSLPSVPEVQLSQSFSPNMEFQQEDYQLGPQETIWEAELEKEREQCWRDFLEGTNYIDTVKRLAKKNNIQRWTRKEEETVDILIDAMTVDWNYWADSKNMELLKIYTEIVGEMAKLVEFESKRLKKKNRKLRQLVYKFRDETMPYLKQEDFDVQGAVEFDNYEKTRTLKALVRLFKCMQLLPLSQSNPDKKDSGLRGEKVVRNRCKRLTSFLSEAHRFDSFLLKLINSGEVDIDAMYVCRDHKSEKKGKKKKPRVMAGLLFYFVCPSSQAAENLLRKFCQFCEAEGESQATKDIHQKMFRKDDSTKGDTEEDLRKRRRLCSGEPWTEEDFQNQKNMFHFALALSKPQLFLQGVDESTVNNNLDVIKEALAKVLDIAVSEIDIKNVVKMENPNGTSIELAKPACKNIPEINERLAKELKKMSGFENLQVPDLEKAEMEKPQSTCPPNAGSRPASRKGSLSELATGSVGY